MVGIAMVAALSAMPGAARMNFIAGLGELSLPIYLAHMVAAAIVRMVLVHAHVMNLPVHLVLGTSTGIAAPVALFVVANRLGIPGVFRWGKGKRRVAKSAKVRNIAAILTPAQ
jgi:peptidoglycan/LPS O-acetylase OafA/YrhL